MSENHPTTLNCPACGAPLDFDGKSTVVRCNFCHNLSLVPGFLPAQAAAPRLALDEIRRLAESGNLLEAVKQYRAIYGVGLKEAKDAVDALSAGRLVEPSETATGAQAPEELTRVLEEVKQLLAAGNKIEAVKKYREAYDVSLTRAKYAVEQIEAGQTLWPEAGFPAQTAPVQEAPGVKTGKWLGCVLTLAILLFVGGIVLFGLSQAGGPLNPRYYANGPIILLPSDSGTAPDVAALFYNPDADTRFIGLVEADTGKLRWKTEPLAGDGYADAISLSADLVYVANGTGLLAYRKSDGSLAWQAQMPDKLNYGEPSLLVTDGRVITLNVDQSLQAYDAVTGNLAWSRRLAGYDRTLRLMGSSLVLLDYTGDDYTYSLIFLDPADGSQQRLFTPTCQYTEYSSATLDVDSGFVYDEAGNAIYLIFDSSYGCVQRLDLASGQMTWQILAEDSFSFSSSGFQSLMTETSLYFSSGNQLLVVDKRAGTLQTPLTDEDYEFLPLAVTGDRLIVRARRTRGTERFELWGLDSTSGEQLWQMNLENAAPIDPPNELVGLVDETDSGWTWKLVPVGLMLVKFQAKPNQLVLETVNLADGTILSEQTVALKRVTGDFYSVPTVVGWQDNLLYLSLDSNIYALDVSTGKLKFDY